jgi:HD-like signal output (HDOD) protein
MTALEKLFANLPRLPSIPKVVLDLIASLCDDDVDIESLVVLVKQDQSLSARVLATANSSHYGVSKKIGAINHAVTLIGLSALRSLVIASGMSRTFSNVGGVDMKAFWRHGLVTAGVARVIAKGKGINPEFAYTAGLMYQIGELIIHLAYPAASKQLLLKMERSLTETDHCEVGQEMAVRWNFPVEIRNALRWYVEPLEPEAEPMAAVVHIAAQIAEGLEQGLGAEEISVSLNIQALARLSLDRPDTVWRIESCMDLPATSAQLL